MSKPVTITLPTPILGHGDPIHAIILREPTFDEYLTIGDPYEVGESADGVRFTVQNPDAVRAYIETCLVQPKSPLMLAQASANTARKVRAAVLGFFQDGDEAAEASKTSPTS